MEDKLDKTRYNSDRGGEDEERGSRRQKRTRRSNSPQHSTGQSRLFQASISATGRSSQMRVDRRGDSNGKPNIKVRDEVNIVTSKPEIKEVFTNPDVMNRNKRLFGSLMGHLGSAQSKLERDSEAIKKQTEKTYEVAKKNAEESKRLEALKREETRKASYDFKISMVKTSFETWKSQMEAVDKFIYTDIEPKIAWIPAHHNKASKDLLANKQDEVRIYAGNENCNVNSNYDFSRCCGSLQKRN